MKNTIGVVLMLVALALLVPGITKPILQLSGTVDKAAMVDIGMEELANHPDVPGIMLSLTEQLVSQLDVKGQLPAYEKSRSIFGTIDELYANKQYLVAFLIALFSIIIPALKCLLMVVSVLLKNRFSTLSDSLVRLISKWSMADVFVVAIIVAYMAANATEHTDELFTLTAVFGEGFYYFLGFCLLSIASTQFISRPDGAPDTFSSPSKD